MVEGVGHAPGVCWIFLRVIIFPSKTRKNNICQGFGSMHGEEFLSEEDSRIETNEIQVLQDELPPCDFEDSGVL